MAQKKDKDRKQNLLNYKNQVKNKMASKKTEEASLQNVKQYPVWKSQAEISMSGLEWESIYNVLNIFRQAIVASESVMQRNIEKGVIEMKFVDDAGKELNPEEIETYTKELQSYFAAKQAEENAKGVTDVPTSNGTDTPSSPILSETGEKQPAANPLKAV